MRRKPDPKPDPRLTMGIGMLLIITALLVKACAPLRHTPLM